MADIVELTPYHSKLIAYEITRRCPSDSSDKLAGALVDAQVDLNPHQIEAALFAFKSPFSKGALLADEVGLGKTIEAGLILSQRWAERKRRMLVITPSNLRKQWYQELTEKFFLPCSILESRSYNECIKKGEFQPFQKDEIVICSYQFAKSKAADVATANWDIVVMDEAHRLRNVCKPSNVIGRILKEALAKAPKVLLTATPLQNSLLELFGLVSFVDEYSFGDLNSFKQQFSNLSEDQVYQTLRERLKPICHRTLRRQVLPYVRYTKRLPIVERFTPDEAEDRLYNLVSEYLRRGSLQALPNSQRSLITLVLRKLLASSTFAIAGALDSMIDRLRKQLGKDISPQEALAEISQDYDAYDETEEEWEEDETPLTAEDREAIDAELKELESFRNLAISIKHNAKGKSLIKALETAFARANEIGAKQKAIIFTESRRTQDYLQRVLADTPWGNEVVLFNGSNNDDRSKQIYAAWLEKHQGTGMVTGSRTADMRSALVEYFRDSGKIMIATEAGAEGINLQFCSLVVNYDLPWNPQRIEQRIGRCHRYGQVCDVVVVNFLNQKNEADQRVFELLSEKFKLFDGVFGASDEVLGAIESGVDFEKRIVEIYQRCRHADEIKAAFDKLQSDLSAEINDAMVKTRQQLIENFDQEVTEKLKLQKETSEANLNRFEKLLIQLAQFELKGHADFLTDSSFRLKSLPFKAEVPMGLYELPRRSGDAYFFRLNHPLAEGLIAQAKSRELPTATLEFNYSAAVTKISALEPFKGKSGQLAVYQVSFESEAQAEDHLIYAAITDSGSIVEEDLAKRLFSLPAKIVSGESTIVENPYLHKILKERSKTIEESLSVKNANFFDEEIEKLDKWSEDKRISLKKELNELEDRIKEIRKQTRGASLPDRLKLEKEKRTLESKRDVAWKEYELAKRGIEGQKENLIQQVEHQLNQTSQVKNIFNVRWSLR
jgi:adenine-specific DNA-methyltransferase